MELNITSQKKNPLFNREEICAIITSEKNPTNKEVVEALKSDENLTIIKSIKGSFGDNKFKAEVTIYANKEAKDNAETIPRKVRKKLAEEAKKAAEAAKVETK